MKVLSFAAVGIHGRECRARAVGASLALVVAVSGFAQPLSSQDVAAELAARIASVVTPPEPIQLSTADADAPLRADLVRLLRARGLQVADAATVTVRVTCGENLRDDFCAADIERRGGRQVVAVSKPRVSGTDRAVEPSVTLTLRPVYAQRAQMLDVAPVADQLIVLEPGRLTLRPRRAEANETPPPIASVPVLTARSMPRDVRGRVRATGESFEALLPGVTCRGVVKPFSANCADEGSAWPLGIDNSGIVASRNHFSTPEGLGFFGVASIGTSAAPAWLMADDRGALVFLDAQRAPAGRAGAADDIIRIQASCSAGAYVVTSSRAAGAEDVDEVQLQRIVERALVPVATVRTTGIVTALWADAGASHATAIVRSGTVPRYEAFAVSVSCVR